MALAGDKAQPRSAASDMEIIAAIQAASVAVKSVCDVLLSPEGQKTMAIWREDGAALRKAIGDAGAWIEGIVKGLSAAGR